MRFWASRDERMGGWPRSPRDGRPIAPKGIFGQSERADTTLGLLAFRTIGMQVGFAHRASLIYFSRVSEMGPG